MGANNNNSPQSTGAGMGIFGYIAIALILLLFVAKYVVGKLFAPHTMSLPQFILTLVHWHATVVYRTTIPLSAPLRWHWVAVATMGIGAVVGLVADIFIMSKLEDKGGWNALFGINKKHISPLDGDDPAKWLPYKASKYTAYTPASVVRKDAVRPSLKTTAKKDRWLEDYGFVVGYVNSQPNLPIAISSELSILVTGEPRSGKTAGLVIPWVASWHGPVVTTSTRNEVAIATHHARRLVSGDHIYSLALPNTLVPEGIVPISYDICWFYPDEMSSIIESAERRASMFAAVASDKGQPIWESSAKQVFACLLIIAFAWRKCQVDMVNPDIPLGERTILKDSAYGVYRNVLAKSSSASATKGASTTPPAPPQTSIDASHTKAVLLTSHLQVLQDLASMAWAVNPDSVSQMVRFIEQIVPRPSRTNPDSSLVSMNSDKSPAAEYIKNVVKIFGSASDDTEFSRTVIGLVQVGLGKLNDMQIAEMFITPYHVPVFDPDEFLDKSGTLYLISRSDDSADLGKFFALVINEITAAARRRAQRMGRCEPGLALILDEIANIAPLPNLKSYMSEGGGTGITTAAIVQNLKQLISIYTDSGKDEIVSSANVILAFGGAKAPEDLALYAQMAPEKVVLMQSFDSTGKKAGTSESLRASLTVNQIANMPAGWMFVKLPNADPLIVKSTPCNENLFFGSKDVNSQILKWVKYRRNVSKWTPEWGRGYDPTTTKYPFHGVNRYLSWHAMSDLVYGSKPVPLMPVSIDVPVPQIPDEADGRQTVHEAPHSAAVHNKRAERPTPYHADAVEAESGINEAQINSSLVKTIEDIARSNGWSRSGRFAEPATGRLHTVSRGQVVSVDASSQLTDEDDDEDGDSFPFGSYKPEDSSSSSSAMSFLNDDE